MLAWIHGALIDPIDAAETPSWVPDDLAQLTRALVQSRIADRPAGARDALNRIGLASAPRTSRTIPFLGARDVVESLARTLEMQGVAALIGPVGSGRSRVIEEAARTTQERIARTGADVPTFARTHSPDRVSRPDAPGALRRRHAPSRPSALGRHGGLKRARGNRLGVTRTAR